MLADRGDRAILTALTISQCSSLGRRICASVNGLFRDSDLIQAACSFMIRAAYRLWWRSMKSSWKATLATWKAA
jgi:hypothetical protein